MIKYNNIYKSVAVLAIGIILFCIASIAPTQAYAQTSPKQSLTIYPILEEIHINKPSPYTYTITINNTALNPMGIHVDANAFDPEHLNDPQKPLPPLTKWLTTSETDFIIPSQSKKEILVTIKPDPSAHGSYFGTLIFTPFISQKKQPTTPIILTRFIAPIFLTIGNQQKALIAISDFKPTSNFFSDTFPTFSFGVKSVGDTYITAKPRLTITPLFSNPITILPTEKHVFPGLSRTWQEEVNVPKYRFIYTSRLSISTRNGQQITKDSIFIIVPQQFLLDIGLVIVLLIVVLSGKRLQKAVGILLGAEKA